MHQYTAYGLRIDSKIALPELRERQSSDEAADVLIEETSLTPVQEDPDDDSGRRLDVGPGWCRISYDDIGTVRIEDGNRVLVDPETADVLSTKLFRRLLEGQVLGVCCHQRGLLVLHGSAVQIDGEGVVFLGPTGAGKSTTAAAFYGAGYPVLDDDIIVIDSGGDSPTIAPGIPQLKLTPAMSDRLDIDVERGEGGQSGPDKTHYPTETDAVDRFGVPLKGCYVLREESELSIEPVCGQDALFELIANTYTSGLLDETERTATNFQQCSGIVATKPVRLLSRPKDIGLLPDLVDAVVDDVTDG